MEKLNTTRVKVPMSKTSLANTVNTALTEPKGERAPGYPGFLPSPQAATP